MYEEKDDCSLVVCKLLVPPPPSAGMVKMYNDGIVVVNIDYSTGLLCYPCQSESHGAVVFTRW